MMAREKDKDTVWEKKWRLIPSKELSLLYNALDLAMNARKSKHHKWDEKRARDLMFELASIIYTRSHPRGGGHEPP